MGAHEERFDGTGYPDGLSGDEIPLESRIVACAAAQVKLARYSPVSHSPRPSSSSPGAGALDPDVVTAALAQLVRERSHPSRLLRDKRACLIQSGTRRAIRAAVSSARMGYPLLLSPLGDRADRDPQPHRLDRASDDPRRRRAAHRRLRRLPRRARARRRRAICIEATAVHPSGLLTAHTIAGYDPRSSSASRASPRRCTRAAPGSSCTLPRRPRADRPPPLPPAVRPSAVPTQRFHAEPRAFST